MKTLSVLIFALSLMMLTACATSSIERTHAVYRISFPVGKQVVEFPIGTLQLDTKDSNLPWYFLSDKTSGLNVSFNFDRRRICNSGESCRDYLANVKMPKNDDLDTWRASQLGDAYLFEWMVGPTRSLGGFHIRHHHMHANYYIDGTWVDVHLSKVYYEEKDRDVFIDFVKSIKFRQK
jgi:hypothetical protein